MLGIVYQNTTSPLAQFINPVPEKDQVVQIQTISNYKLVKSDHAHGVKGTSVGSDFDLLVTLAVLLSPQVAQGRRQPCLLNSTAQWTGIWLDGQRVIYILKCAVARVEKIFAAPVDY